MTSTPCTQRIEQANRLCTARGGRMTRKRQRLLSLLLDCGQPLSAYQIADLHEQRFGERLTIMSIYRMLHFLTSVQLIHRLDTTNQYLACNNLLSGCKSAAQHGATKFLICDKCNQVLESNLCEDVLQRLSNDIADAGFTMEQQQIEIHGTCDRCAEKALNASAREQTE